MEALLAGARVAVDRAESDDLLKNPPALYGALHWAADTGPAARVHVLMPYTDRLREFAEWYRQLWAESLGKRVDRNGKSVHVGPTPVGAVGATDQHSQVQLFMEGPYDKVITFMTVDDLGVDLPIPGSPKTAAGSEQDLPPDLEYLPGHTLGELLRAEYEATSAALAEMGRMSCTLCLPDLAPGHPGGGDHVLPARHRVRRRLVRHRPVRSARGGAGQAFDLCRHGAFRLQDRTEESAIKHRRGVARNALRVYRSRPTFGRPMGTAFKRIDVHG